MEIKYHPEADEEVFQAVQWYENIDDQLAVRFKLELDRAERLVLQSPDSWSRYFHSTQGFRLKGFPYVMAYLQRDERLVVVALAHTRRAAGYWKNRIDT